MKTVKINWLFPFENDYALFTVLDENNKRKFGLIDRKGEVIIEPIYGVINRFDDSELMTVRKGEHWAIMNTKGEVVLPFKYNYLWPWDDNEHYNAQLNGQWGVINYKGEVIIPFRPMSMLSGPENGYLRFSLSNDPSNRQFGLLDLEGNTVLEPVHNFMNSDDWFIVNKDGQWYYLDKDLNKVLSFVGLEVVSLGLGWHNDLTTINVKIEGEKRQGLINRRGEFVIEPIYDYVGYYGNSDFMVARIGEKRGVINLKGEVIVPFEYLQIEITGDSQEIEVQNDKGEWGVINLKGEMLLPFMPMRWLRPQNSKGWRVIYAMDSSKEGNWGKCGLIDSIGKVLLEPIYDGIYIWDEDPRGWIKVRKDGECYYLDENLEKQPLF